MSFARKARSYRSRLRPRNQAPMSMRILPRGLLALAEVASSSDLNM